MVPVLDDLKSHLATVRPGTRFQVDRFVRAQIPDDAAALLMEYGTLEPGRTARLIRMTPSGCHENATKLAARYGWEVWTGFALSDDGCWRVHSWCRNKRGRIVETTITRTDYFGIPISPR